jgi:ABC-type sugar transport system ATPase subunit
MGDRTDGILVLDEPTASLRVEETDLLFSAVRKVAARGCAVLFVSHNLNEVLDLCDTATVLREGRRVEACATAGLTEDDLIRLITGREIDEMYPEFDGVAANRPVVLRAQLRSHEVRELDLDSRQLQRGLLIGRYSDRCSLAGHGRNLSRVHALVTEESPRSLLVYDLASTNGVRPAGMTEGPSHAVVRLTEDSPVMLGHFELAWVPSRAVKLH